MQIRKGTLDDVPAIVRMSREFYPTTHYAAWTDMDEETVGSQASDLIANHVFFVAERDGQIVGMVGVYVLPFMFNRHTPCAYEVVWWVSPDARGSRIAASLLRAIEPPCKERGASRIVMAHMPNSPPQAAALYKLMGYVESEIMFTKDI